MLPVEPEGADLGLEDQDASGTVREGQEGFFFPLRAITADDFDGVGNQSRQESRFVIQMTPYDGRFRRAVD